MLHTSLLLENIDLSGATHYKRLSACCISNPYGNIENVTGTDICFWSPYYFTKAIKEQRQSTLVNRCIHFSKLCHVDSCSMSFQFLNQLTLCCTLFNPSKLCRIQNMHGQPSLFNEWRTNSGYIISIKLQHLATTLVIQNIILTKRCLGKKRHSYSLNGQISPRVQVFCDQCWFRQSWCFVVVTTSLSLLPITCTTIWRWRFLILWSSTPIPVTSTHSMWSYGIRFCKFFGKFSSVENNSYNNNLVCLYLDWDVHRG